LLGYEQNAGYLVLGALWMGLGTHLHVQETVTVLEQRLMVLITLSFFFADQQFHTLSAAGQ
jgi:hypothetical protein